MIEYLMLNFFIHVGLYKMGCSPDKQRNNIVELKPERISSNKATGSSVFEDKNQNSGFQHFNVSLFLINEVSSKFEESNIPSKGATVVTPQKTEHFKDN